jgi:hypothetical protein
LQKQIPFGNDKKEGGMTKRGREDKKQGGITEKAGGMTKMQDG